MERKITRRAAVGQLTAAAAFVGLGRPGLRPAALRGNVHHSVCKWCYPNLTLDELARGARDLGIASIELLGPEDWPVLARHDLVCAMALGPGDITKGWNNPAYHDGLVEGALVRLPEVAKAGYPNMIVFSGNRDGMDDEAGLAHCVTGLQRILPAAERLGVTVCMELLNSKVDHADYMCDHTAWGVELVQRLGSDRFKLLYDIYHMQIMEGDVIRTIRENADYIGHYHTGGNPGRHEIDETQELNYRAIVQAIVDTGFKGYIAQEFIPARDPLASLGQAIGICDV